MWLSCSSSIAENQSTGSFPYPDCLYPDCLGKGYVKHTTGKTEMHTIN